jgi:hypothetical protein
MSFSMNDPSVDLSELLEHMMGEYDSVSFSVRGGPSEVDADSSVLGRRLCHDHDARQFREQVRMRAIFDHVHHSIEVDELSRSGATSKRTVGSGFPQLDGGYDEHRNKTILFEKTAMRWWIKNAAAVMTKRDHLPTVAEKRRLSEARWRLQGERLAETNGESDLPDRLLAYPRPYCKDLPAPGEMKNLLLQCSLDTPIVVDDRARFRVRLQGLTGTHGNVYTSRVISGKEISAAIDVAFKSRKALLANLKKRIELAPNMAHDIEPNATLMSGCTIPFETLETKDTVLPAGEFRVATFHVAWSSDQPKTRRLVITGMLVLHAFERPAKETPVDVETCATCLEDVVGDAWVCRGCQKSQHHGCFAQWRTFCGSRGHTLTCPNCRAVVEEPAAAERAASAPPAH